MPSQHLETYQLISPTESRNHCLTVNWNLREADRDIWHGVDEADDPTVLGTLAFIRDGTT